jgi:hypothetical protein
MSVTRIRLFNKKETFIVEHSKNKGAQRKTLNKLRKSYKERLNTFQLMEPSRKDQRNPETTQPASTTTHEERALFLLTKIRKTNEKAWFRNFHPNPGDGRYFEHEKQDLIDTNVDYIVTESGKVEVSNDTKMITTLTGKVVNDTYTAELIQKLRLRRKENERHFYTPRAFKVNPIEHNFSINGSQICETDSKYMTLLIVVPSIPSHSNVRNAIRKTYGSYSNKSFVIDHINIEVTVKLMFLLGKDGDVNTERSVQNESKVYNDIVESDFVESYKNLTRKMLIALKWVSIYCSNIDFLLKVDEDVFVNIPNLANELHKRLYGIKGAVYGYINQRASVHRSGKWAVSKDEFPLSYYPNYASGNSYVISGNIITDMFITSEYIPYMPIEDAFITGCLARILRAKVVPIPGFTYWNDGVPDPCTFVKNRKISATKVTIPLMGKLWKASTSFRDMCERTKTNLKKVNVSSKNV